MEKMVYKNEGVPFSVGVYLSFVWKSDTLALHSLKAEKQCAGSYGHTYYKPTWKDKWELIARIIWL